LKRCISNLKFYEKAEGRWQRAEGSINEKLTREGGQGRIINDK
jgi:hypothetical protein